MLEVDCCRLTVAAVEVTAAAAAAAAAKYQERVRPRFVAGHLNKNYSLNNVEAAVAATLHCSEETEMPRSSSVPEIDHYHHLRN